MIYVTRTEDGNWISWGRHTPKHYRDSEGGASVYMGESAKVLDLLLLGCGKEKPCRK